MSDFQIEKTLLYQKRLEEKKHIENDKWYMSERAGKDVGWEKALLDWLLNKNKYLK